MALQFIISIVFLYAGTIKLLTPKAQLSDKGLKGFEGMPPLLINLLALAEVIGAFLLIFLTVLQAGVWMIRFLVFCYTMLMIAASFHHLKRKEFGNLGLTFILFFVCLFILIFK